MLRICSEVLGKHEEYDADLRELICGFYSKHLQVGGQRRADIVTGT